jgi:hypothetical protein
MFFCDSEEQIWADVGSDVAAVAAVAVPQQAHDRQSIIQKQQLQHHSKPLPLQQHALPLQQQQQQRQEQEPGTAAADEAPRRKPRANISALLSS